MTTLFDLSPATTALADLVRAVRDEQLAAPTPCPAYTLGDLLDHVGGLAVAFTWAARKDGRAHAGAAPSGGASGLVGDWRDRIADDLGALAVAWEDPAAWTGTTAAGGVEMPGDVAALVALDEVVVHGWDVARASGQPSSCDPVLLATVHEFVRGFAGPGQEEARAGLFGPEVAVAADAPLLDRVLGMTGRDPAWRPA